MNTIKLKAYAKINLGLDVVRKREDGYHEVRMIMQTISLHDKLTIKVTDQPSIRMNTNLPYLPNDENNLVYKAAALLKKEFGIEQGVYINLEKKIPVAAGLAGGSSDAAATLHGMNRLFHLNLSNEELMKFGLRLGADVPYCVMRGTALSEGIGEILTPLPPFPKCYVLIVKPPINVSTKFVYENLKIDESINHPDIDGIIKFIKEDNLKEAVKLFGNVLESVTEKNYPIIMNIKETMLEYGALTSLMSGSGPTVFGIFDDKKKVEKAFYDFKISNIGKQVFLTELHQPRYHVLS
jgi:4-diphosphocytidyl-2-C-methyl-D-erythritol kinase